MKVYVVQGEHWTVPGINLTVHATEDGANAKAAELVNGMLDEVGLARRATPRTWEKHLDRIRAKLDRDGVYDYDTGEDASLDVWVTPRTVLGQ